jgi:hypothetical protein
LQPAQTPQHGITRFGNEGTIARTAAMGAEKGRQRRVGGLYEFQQTLGCGDCGIE